MMSTSLRALVLAGVLLPALGSLGVRAETPVRAQPVRYVCNADGRCFETGDLDRPDDYYAPRPDYHRPPPTEFERDDRDFDRRPPPRDFDRSQPPREYDRRGPRDDDDPD